MVTTRTRLGAGSRDLAVRKGRQGPLWKCLRLEEAKGCLMALGEGAEARVRRGWRHPRAHLGVTRRPLGGTTSSWKPLPAHSAPRQVSSCVVTPSLPLDRGTLSPLGLS